MIAKKQHFYNISSARSPISTILENHKFFQFAPLGSTFPCRRPVSPGSRSSAGAVSMPWSCRRKYQRPLRSTEWIHWPHGSPRTGLTFPLFAWTTAINGSNPRFRSLFLCLAVSGPSLVSQPLEIHLLTPWLKASCTSGLTLYWPICFLRCGSDVHSHLARQTDPSNQAWKFLPFTVSTFCSLRSIDCFAVDGLPVLFTVGCCLDESLRCVTSPPPDCFASEGFSCIVGKGLSFVSGGTRTESLLLGCCVSFRSARTAADSRSSPLFITMFRVNNTSGSLQTRPKDVERPQGSFNF